MAETRLALAALMLEAALGYPDALHRRLPHPVTALGAAISGLERAWNDPARSNIDRRLRGVATMAIVGGAAASVGALTTALLRSSRRRPGPRPLRATEATRAAVTPFEPDLGPGLRRDERKKRGELALALIATTGLAQRSLYDHTAAVLHALDRDDLPCARTAVARIVGRDTAALDASGVAAAALESLAESFNDAVVAPAFWLALAGLPGLFAYKAANTADSLIGHREPRWRAFGWAAARLDDVMNLAPARLAGGLIALAGRGGWRTMLRDAAKHASPNAGWPEAAMAGALGVRLGGPASYDGVVNDRPTLGDGRAPAAADLRHGLRVYVAACGLLWLGMGALAWRR